MQLTPDIYFALVPPTLDMSRRTELFYINEFSFAVAVILSAQATDKKVNEITPGLFAVADTPDKMLKLGTDGLKQHIKVISFFNNKANNIFALAKILASSAQCAASSDWQFDTKYHDRTELMKLPGIGQKTANVIMNVLWGAPNIGVDTHVFRLSHRFGWSYATTPDKTEADLIKLIPPRYHSMVNHVMVLHGRYVCKAINPLCSDCPVVKYCPVRRV